MVERHNFVDAQTAKIIHLIKYYDVVVEINRFAAQQRFACRRRHMHIQHLEGPVTLLEGREGRTG